MPRLGWKVLGNSTFMICPLPVNSSFDFSKNTVYLYSTNSAENTLFGKKLLA